MILCVCDLVCCFEYVTDERITAGVKYLAYHDHGDVWFLPASSPIVKITDFGLSRVTLADSDEILHNDYVSHTQNTHTHTHTHTHTYKSDGVNLIDFLACAFVNTQAHTHTHTHKSGGVKLIGFLSWGVVRTRWEKSLIRLRMW